MSADLVWEVIRKNHAFLMKAKGIGKTFSKEPGNLKNFNSPRLSGIANRSVVGIKAAADGKGLILTTSRPIGGRHVKKGVKERTLKSGTRPTYRTIRRSLKSAKVSRKLRSLAVRRASALIAGQRVKPADNKKSTNSDKSSKKST